MTHGYPRLANPGDERGATLVVVALSLVAILGMVVLSVDLGGLLVKRRGMVNSADSAALAGAETFALNQAQVGVNEAPAQARADALAQSNQSNSVRDSWQVTAGLPRSSCDPNTCGSVAVGYHGQQPLFFAPALGFGQSANVNARATAIWGPAGAAHPAPIMIRYDWMTNECAAPVPNPNPPTECDFWLNDHDDNGNPLWAWINLNLYPGSSAGWNVPQTYNCPNVGSSDRSNWIHGVDVPTLPVNPIPSPTFVCTVSGHAAANFSDMQDIVGQYRVFPVNDASGVFAPPGQVDNGGAYCAPNTSCTPDKYDIVGFNILRVDQVLHGNDAAAIGTQPDSGTCSPNHNFSQNPPNDTWDLDAQSCTITSLRYKGDPSKLYPKLSKGSTTYLGGVTGACGVDYCYDTVTHVITWTQGSNQNNVKVEWDWSTPGTPGKCGIRDSDPNAICLVVSWQGFRTGGINPGGGEDFGLRAIRLSG
jgi:hypothetical protein